MGVTLGIGVLLSLTLGVDVSLLVEVDSVAAVLNVLTSWRRAVRWRGASLKVGLFGVGFFMGRIRSVAACWMRSDGDKVGAGPL